MKKNMILWLLLFLISSGLYAQEVDSMKSSILQNSMICAAGGLIAVESTMLLIGMNIPEMSSWTNMKNTSFALTDILMGGLLIYFSLSGKDYSSNPWYYSSVGLLLLTHMYREAEYFRSISEPFIHNSPLFILNNVRLGLLGGSLGISLYFKF